jgi:creatinine amidohydrolase
MPRMIVTLGDAQHSTRTRGAPMAGARHEVRWERMFPHELNAAFEACPALYFPYGLCEPHGPQNAVGLDALKAHGILVETARRHGGIVAPPDYWHIHEVGGYASWADANVGDVKPWLSAVPPWVHFKNVVYHIRAAEMLDFRAALFLTGHYGPNWEDLKTVLQLAQPFVRVRLFGLPDFEANEPGFDGSSGDHAGKVETSLLWALEPECVDIGRVPAKPELPLFAMGANAGEASRAIGERMVDDEVAWLGAKKDELLAAWDPDAESRLRSFDDVERFWAEQVAPRIPEFKSMQKFRNGRDAPEEGSRWSLNFDVGGWTG